MRHGLAPPTENLDLGNPKSRKSAYVMQLLGYYYQCAAHGLNRGVGRLVDEILL